MSEVQRALAGSDDDVVEMMADMSAINGFLELCGQMQDNGMHSDDIILALAGAVSCALEQKFIHLEPDKRLEIFVQLVRGCFRATKQ